MDFPTIMETVPLCPNSPGVIGHGEGVLYKNKYYFYRSSHSIPKGKVVHVTWEGNWCGRVHGDKDYLIVLKTDDGILVLEECIYDIKGALKKYAGLSPEQAMKLADEVRNQRDWKLRAPLCSGCGKPFIKLRDGQPNDLCSVCYRRRSH